jgi:outer membrane biosynthesis protein TonB
VATAASREVEDLLGTIEGGGRKAAPARPAAAVPAAPTPAAPAAPAAAPAGGKSLSREQVSQVVRGAKARIQTCYEAQAEPKLSGTLMVSFTILPTGRVGSATLKTPRFEGTPVGNCVASTVRSLSFPPHTDPPVEINYPFILR